MRLGLVASSKSNAVFAEDWTGTNGAAWNATRWPYQRNNTGSGGSGVTIQSNVGQIASSGTGSSWYAINNVDVANFELTIKGIWPSLTSRIPEIAYRITGNLASGNPSGGYAVQPSSTSGGRVDLLLNGVGSLTNVAATALHANVTAWFKIRAVGTNHKVRWWLSGNAEPGTWQIDYTDATTTAAGRILLRNWAASAVQFDDLTVIAAAA